MPNTTIFENVTFTVGGPNPQTKTVQVAFSVDPNTGIGNATASFAYTGANAGVDTVTAALTSFGLTSNPASVAWQAAPGLLNSSNAISVGVIHNGASRGFNITSAIPFLYTLTVPSLYYNANASASVSQPFPFSVPGLATNGNINQNPGLFAHITPQGTYAGAPDVPLQNAAVTIKDGPTDFKMVMQGSFVVKQAGNISISFPTVNDSVLMSIGNGASHVSGNLYNPFGQVTGPYTGFPILLAANGSASDNQGQSPQPYTDVINFPTPGIYPFEIDYNNAFENGGALEISFNGTNVVVPVAIQPAAPQPPVGSQNLQLTPTGGPANLLIQGNTVTLNLALQNVQFTTRPIITLLEGSVGQVYIYNDPVNPTFSFQSYYGATPDGPSAAAQDFIFVGDNTAWQGQVSLRWDAVASKFEIFYNGSQSLANNQLIPTQVQSTNLTITQEDIAWFDGLNTSYDVFQATAAGGGKFASIPVFYQLNPNYPAGTAVQVSPNTIVAGTTVTFTVTLARPLPPIQNNTVLGVAFSGTQPLPGSVTVTPNLATISGVQNWLVSYSVKATFQGAASASTTTMQFTFTAPSITFLGTLGTAVDAFTTKTNYVYTGPQPTALITIQAGATLVPFNVSFSEKKAGVQLFPNGPGGTPLIGATTTLQATWVSYNNNFKNTVFYVTPALPNGAAKITLGTVLAASAVITSIGGGKYQAVFTLTVSTAALKMWNIAPFPGYGGQYNAYSFSYLGTCTDNTSVAYTDTNGYFSSNP
jgi:hypothetical protein